MSTANKVIALFNNDINGSIEEPTSKTEIKIIKFNNMSTFIKLFISKSPLLRDANLSKREKAILHYMLGSWIRTSNRVEISTALRHNLSKKLKYSLSSVYKGLNSLSAKGIFVERQNNEDGVKGSLYLNPNIFGRKHWIDIKKLQYDIQVDFDFNEYESHSTYSSNEVPRNINLKVDFGVQDILLHKLTLEVQEVKNKKKELEIELKKLDVDELRLKIEAKKIGINLP